VSRYLEFSPSGGVCAGLKGNQQTDTHSDLNKK